MVNRKRLRSDPEDSSVVKSAKASNENPSTADLAEASSELSRPLKVDVSDDEQKVTSSVPSQSSVPAKTAKQPQPPRKLSDRKRRSDHNVHSPVKKRRGSGNVKRLRSVSNSRERSHGKHDTPKRGGNRRRKSYSADNTRHSLPALTPIDSKPVLDRYQFGSYRYPKELGSDIVNQRMAILNKYRKLLESKSVFEIGCGVGETLRNVCVTFDCSECYGIDIEGSLIRTANNAIRKFEFAGRKLTFKSQNFLADYSGGSEMPNESYDCILLMSVSKWIHLTYGDNGLIFAFRKINALLKKGGSFVLEPHMWPSYKQRRKMNDKMFRNYNGINLLPDKFADFLVEECNFSSYHKIGEIKKVKKKKAFTRPVYIFYKL